MVSAAVNTGSMWIPLLEIDEQDWAKSTSVDIAQLIADLVWLSDQEMKQQLAQAGVHFESVEWEMLPWHNEVMLHSTQWWPWISESLNTPNIHDLMMLFEKHMWYFHELSPHAWNPRNNLIQYQKYIEHLESFWEILPESCRKRLEKFRYPETPSRATLLRSLSRQWLLPEQVLFHVNEQREIDWLSHISVSTVASYSGMLSYKKIFDEYLRLWIIVPGSYKVDITNQELLEFIRATFSKALDFLWKYLCQPEVWQFIQKEYGEGTMKSLFTRFEGIESGYSERISKVNELQELKPLDFTVFYGAYVSLVKTLFELEAIPQNITLGSLKEDARSA